MSAFLAQAQGIAGTNTQTVVTNADGSTAFIVRTTTVTTSQPQWKLTAGGLVLLAIILSLVIFFRRSKST